MTMNTYDDILEILVYSVSLDHCSGIIRRWSRESGT